MSYWSKRQKKGLSALEKRETAIKKRLNRLYKLESARLSKLIASFYQQYGSNDIIQYRTLMQSLDDASKQLLLEDWDKFAQAYPQYAHLLPVRENIYKLNRLEGLQMSVELQLDDLAGKTIDAVTGHLTSVAEDALKSISKDLHYEYNPEVMKNFVNRPWADGSEFSTSIWNNTQKLAKYLTTDIAQGIARGDSYKKLAKNINERFDKVSRRDAYRLIYTEGTYIYNQATLSVVKNDFEFYKISTVGDGKVCPLCRSFDDKTFKLEDAEAGVNFPPFHPWCRCSFEIVIPDRQQWLQDYINKHGSAGNDVLDRVDTGDDNG